MQAPPPPALPSAPGRQKPFRFWLCLLIGCVLAAVIGTAEPYLTVYLVSSYLFTDFHSGGAAFFVIVLFLIFNAAGSASSGGGPRSRRTSCSSSRP